MACVNATDDGNLWTGHVSYSSSYESVTSSYSIVFLDIIIKEIMNDRNIWYKHNVIIYFRLPIIHIWYDARDILTAKNRWDGFTFKYKNIK